MMTGGCDSPEILETTGVFTPVRRIPARRIPQPSRESLTFTLYTEAL
ncbi:MAG: hypothetical protein VYC25_06515 [Actinomycetota bacterium]|nr:hypothetical protein [Actinomycetota bacterium]